MAYTIRQVTTTEDLLAITNLFKAYTAWLDLDLTFQDFTNELASLPGKYASPSGALLLARSSDGVSTPKSTCPLFSLRAYDAQAYARCVCLG
jgi:hypothetical protein